MNTQKYVLSDLECKLVFIKFISTFLKLELLDQSLLFGTMNDESQWQKQEYLLSDNMLCSYTEKNLNEKF